MDHNNADNSFVGRGYGQAIVRRFAACRRAARAGVRQIFRSRVRLLPGALAGDADLPLPARPDGSGAAAVGTRIQFRLSLLGGGGDPFAEGHFILFINVLRDFVDPDPCGPRGALRNL
jgi:hypothetical protein